MVENLKLFDYVSVDESSSEAFFYVLKVIKLLTIFFNKNENLL